MAQESPVLTLHRWQRFTIQQVDVIVDPDTELPLVVSDRDEPIGEQVACMDCFEPLVAGIATTLCEGDPSMRP